MEFLRKTIWERRFLRLALACVFLGSFSAAGQQTESQVKAAYLYNFTRFVEWPNRPAVDEKNPVVIAVASETSFTDALRKLMQNQFLGGRPIEIKRLKDMPAPQHPHILFIPASSSDQVPYLLEKFRGSDTLTVGESESFTLSGGIIAMFVEDKKMRFSVNQKAAERAGLRMSSQMLKFAKLVE